MADDHSDAEGWLRRPQETLTRLATDLFAAAGMEAEKAACMARLLVLTDMMGRHTHGLAQCEPYLRQIAQGDMATAGGPGILRDTGGTIVWDGGYLPGLWLVDHALETGFARIREHGVVSVAIRRSHHIGCLAALAKAATDRGLYVMLARGRTAGSSRPMAARRRCSARTPSRSASQRRSSRYSSISAPR